MKQTKNFKEKFKWTLHRNMSSTNITDVNEVKLFTCIAITLNILGVSSNWLIERFLYFKKHDWRIFLSANSYKYLYWNIL
jgi:hypothetical protein